MAGITSSLSMLLLLSFASILLIGRSTSQNDRKANISIATLLFYFISFWEEGGGEWAIQLNLHFHQLWYDMCLIFLFIFGRGGGGDGRFTVPSIDVWYVFDFFFFFFKLWLPYKEKYNGHVIVDCKFFYFFLIRRIVDCN